MSSEEAETTAKQQAKEILLGLIEEGYAEDILNTWAYCSQSCNYVYDIVRYVASINSEVHPEVRAFANNLLDDWSK